MRMIRGFRLLAFLLVAVSLGACASTPGQEAASGDGEAAPLIGWLHGPCIALASADVESGTDAVVVTLDDPQRVARARIGRRAGPGDECPALLEDRHAVNVASGASFYLVEPGVTDALAIGVVPQESAASLDGALDIDRDGEREVFEHCATSEGVRFLVRPGGADGGGALWTGYYHLGYDVEADCPALSGKRT